MRNYGSRIPIGENKFAYDQLKRFRSRGYHYIAEISNVWRPPSLFFHHRKGGHVAAAKIHSNNIHFFKIDLARFFYSISKNQIIKSLKRVGFSFEDAREIAIESTVSHDGTIFLPFGFVQSPILASLCFWNSEAFRSLKKLPTGISKSVYVDDILLSHPNDAGLLDDGASSVLAACERANFATNSKKTHPSQITMRTFNLDVGSSELKICEDQFEEFLYRIRYTDTPEQIAGILRYVSYVNEGQADELIRLKNLHQCHFSTVR